LRAFRPSRPPVLPVCLGIHVSIGDKNVEQAIIVEIQERFPRPETELSDRPGQPDR
jgi:hypothetical protein